MPAARPTVDAILNQVARGLTGAAAPKPAPDQKARFERAAAVSQNARANWLGLMALLAFVGVTLMGHRDADFFAQGAATDLPILDIEVPVTLFFVVAPVLVLALYAYLHIYLMALWDALAALEPEPEADPIADRVTPWLIAHAALWYRSHARADGAAAPRALDGLVALVSLAFGWLAAPLVLGLMWFRSLPAHEEWLTLWIALCVWGAAMVGWTSFYVARARMAGRERTEVARARRGLRRWGPPLLLLLGFASWETTEGSGMKYPAIGEDFRVEWRLPLYPANLREAVLVAKPDDWQPYDRWLMDFGKAWRTENNIDPKAELAPAQQRDFWAEAKTEWAARLASLAGPVLRQRDLRNADMTRAVLTRADLRGARLDGADMAQAELQGAELDCWEPAKWKRHCTSLARADLTGVEMQGAVLAKAQMQGAVLSDARMQGAVLFTAQMQGAVLNGAEMQGAVLSGAQMQGANLFGAEMQGAVLIEARMQGAVLGGAQMQRAYLGGAHMQGADLGCDILDAAFLFCQPVNMQGADLGGARMQGADLTWARMQGAVLSGAQMQGADLVGALMQGAVLSGARMQRADLVGALMQGAVAHYAQMQRADLNGAQMQNADCTSAALGGALVQSATLTCRSLEQGQLERAVGDFRTVLPPGLTVASCLEILTREEEEALAHYPEEGEPYRLSRAEVRAALLCDPGERPVRLDYNPFERRYWDR